MTYTENEEIEEDLKDEMFLEAVLSGNYKQIRIRQEDGEIKSLEKIVEEMLRKSGKLKE
tara:strand:- start:380 stop:556 length:177 start_codon:yes stop_codon:yes gene_type:complete